MRILSLVVALWCTTAALAQANPASVRINQLFDFGWKFKAGDVADAQSPGLDDRAWRPLDLPHDFQIEQPWDKAASRARGFKAMGVGWYRKTFQADPHWKGRRVLLDFEGIMLSGTAWLNGKKIGETDYGYLGFEADITDLVRYDGPNVVAVRASTGEPGNSRWYTGGGLFRDVHLVVTDPISIARHGVFVTTPRVSRQSAEVNVQVEVAGFQNQQRKLRIVARILSPGGKPVVETETLAPMKSKLATVEVPLPPAKVSNPQLWSCETPYLYSAEITLVLDGRVIDNYSQKFGIRTIEFSKQFGLKLNGRKVFLKGIADHDDLGAVGVAAYSTSIARMMDKIKAFGFNCIRTSHNPYSESFLNLADEKGILIVDELYDKWGSKVAWAGSAPWQDVWFSNVKEWIKRDRNHPSVIMWSLGNELQFQEARWGFPTGDWGVTTYRILNVVVKRYDPTRKTTVAMYPARAGGIVKADPDFRVPANIIPPELATVTDVASFNYCWEDYPAYLRHDPNLIIFQSEASTNELAAPYFGMDRKKMVGLAYWGAIAYWGESSGWPSKGWDYSFFNHALEPYPQAYLIRSIFSPKPIVHLGIVDSPAESHLWNDEVVGRKYISSHWNREPGRKYDIYAYSNADEVELFVNGKSMGVRRNSTAVKQRNIMLWKGVSFVAGTLVAVARNGGVEVARDQLETTGKPVALKLEPENSAWKADGMDLQYVKVYALDDRGRKVPTAGGEVSFEVSGAARLLAVDNGDQATDRLFDRPTTVLHHGFAMAILRAGTTPGTVRLNVSAAGLKPAEATFQVE